MESVEEPLAVALAVAAAVVLIGECDVVDLRGLVGFCHCGYLECRFLA